MSISQVTIAKQYNRHDPCAICMAPIDPLLRERTGWIVIHNNSNGALHPMHEDCLKQHLAGHSRGRCPICRDPILWPKPEEDRTIRAIASIIINGTAHATLSYLTGRPLLIAITPGVITSLMSIDSLRLEQKELGLRRPLGVEIGIKLATSAAMIGIPLLASITASQITESIIPNSLITATLGTVGLIPFLKRFLDDV